MCMNINWLSKEKIFTLLDFSYHILIACSQVAEV